jgi:hypothetical protein
MSFDGRLRDQLISETLKRPRWFGGESAADPFG